MNKYDVIAKYINVLEQSCSDSADNRPEDERNINTRYAWIYGTALGEINWLLYRLDLTESQVEELSEYIQQKSND
jgi:hypothetical protein